MEKAFTFRPLLKSTLWGGDRIIPFKHLSIKQDNVGESWELSGVDGSESVVDGGACDGMTISELVGEMKDLLLGKANYERFGTEFPLLIKIIDARRQLSIQVHPNDAIARQRGMRNGKTEMWYAMEGEPDAKLRSGLRKHITADEYRQMVADGTIVDAIAEYDVREGDCFFLPAGRIHSIGAGCFLVEIQQTSDCTYRIYDFHRRDKDGNYRELHTEQAAGCIDYRVMPDYRTHYTPARNQRVELVNCPYFHTSVYDLTHPMTIDATDLDSFIILIAMKGQATLIIDGDTSVSIAAGQTVLITAAARTISVSGAISFIETHIG